MKTVVLDGAEIFDLADVHRRFAAALAFPAWYGANLDALRDLLSEPAEDVTVALRNRALLAAALGRRYRALLCVLRDAAAENPRLHIAEE